MESPESRDFLGDVQSLISASNHTNLLIATVPWRYDRVGLDFQITKINIEIETIADEHLSESLLSLHHLPHYLYTTRGLHFSKRGLGFRLGLWICSSEVC